MGNCRMRKKGFVLFTALIAVAVLSIISITVVTLVLNDSMQLNRAEARLIAHYRALSGVEIARALLEKDETKDARGVFRGTITEGGSGNFELVEAWQDGDNWDTGIQLVRDAVQSALQSSSNDVAFAIFSDSSGTEFKIVSYGIRSAAVESVVLNLAFAGGAYEFPVFDMAVFTKSYIGIGGSSRIEGRAGTNSIIPGSVNIGSGNNMITGTIYVGVGGDTHVNPSVNPDIPWQSISYPNAVVTRTNIWNSTWLNNHPIQNLDQEREYELPNFPDPPSSISFPTFPTFPEGLPGHGNLNVGGNSTFTVTQSGEYGNINVSGSSRLIFNLQGNNISINANSLSVSGSARIEVNGPGTLNLYIDGNASISGSGITTLNSAKLNIYTDGNFSASGNLNVEISTLYSKGQTQLGNSGLLQLENLFVDSSQAFSTSGNGTIRVASQALIKASSMSLSSGTMDFMNGSKQQFEIAGTVQLSGNANMNGISKGVMNCSTLNIQQGNINLASGGNMLVYASTGFNMGGGSTFNYGGDRNAVRVNYAGSSDLDLTGNIRYTGTLHIQRASASLGGSGEVYGLIISGGPTVNLHGNPMADVTAVYAPNSTVNMVGSATVKGAIVADRFVATGSSTVVFEPDTEDLFPPQSIGLIGDGEGNEEIEIWSR